MSSPPLSPTQQRVDTEASLAAALKRLSKPLTDDELDEVQWHKEHEQRQQFRRLVDPGIVRTNNDPTADSCIKCLMTICQNILDHPEEEKYRQFKISNARIKRDVMEPKGGLEYAVALGFREHVEVFTPHYVWRPTAQNVANLRIGAYVLGEFYQKILEKEERAKVRKATKQDEISEATLRAKLAFEDDRKAMALKTKMERERRRAALGAQELQKEEELAAAPAAPRTPTPAEHDKDV